MSRHPDPAAIRALRKSAGLTQREVGVLLHTTSRVVQQWETTTGKFGRKMHPAFWDLLQIKITHERDYEITHPEPQD